MIPPELEEKFKKEEAVKSFANAFENLQDEINMCILKSSKLNLKTDYREWLNKIREEVYRLEDSFINETGLTLDYMQGYASKKEWDNGSYY